MVSAADPCSQLLGQVHQSGNCMRTGVPVALCLLLHQEDMEWTSQLGQVGHKCCGFPQTTLVQVLTSAPSAGQCSAVVPTYWVGGIGEYIVFWWWWSCVVGACSVGNHHHSWDMVVVATSYDLHASGSPLHNGGAAY